jgi:hypothetical protein
MGELMVGANGSWTSVVLISAYRARSKQGSNHLTDHAKEVLMNFVQAEQAAMMTSALGGSWKTLFTR